MASIQEARIEFNKFAVQELYKHSTSTVKDPDTIKEFGIMKNNPFGEGADFGTGTHGYINGREMALINNGIPVQKAQVLDLFG